MHHLVEQPNGHFSFRMRTPQLLKNFFHTKELKASFGMIPRTIAERKVLISPIQPISAKSHLKL